MTVVTDPQHRETPGQLRDRVALVTGGTRGIGAAIGHALAEQGAAIAAGYWRHDEPAKKFLARMTEEYPDRRTTLHEGNIGNADDSRCVLQEVIGQHGRLDILDKWQVCAGHDVYRGQGMAQFLNGFKPTAPAEPGDDLGGFA